MVKKSQGYWQSLENTIKEAQEIIEREGWKNLPSQKELHEKGYSSLVTGVTKYHGGLHKLRELLGQKNKVKPRGYWMSLENTINEAKEIMEGEGWENLPSKNTLKEKGYTELNSAISRNYGGIQKFRTLLGQENEKKQMGYWMSLENTINEAKEIMEREGWKNLPSQRMLRRYGYSSLTRAIGKYHGGIPAFRELLRTHLNQPSEGEQLGSLLETYVNGGNEDE